VQAGAREVWRDVIREGSRHDKEEFMYIGIGTLVLILLILAIVYFARRA
jgi:hypothetical protein